MLPFLPKITEVDSIHVLFEKLNMSWMIVCLILPDEKVETIKKDDAPEVFNALKKIKIDEN